MANEITQHLLANGFAPSAPLTLSGTTVEVAQCFTRTVNGDQVTVNLYPASRTAPAAWRVYSAKSGLVEQGYALWWLADVLKIFGC